jgi:hypothetical protein
VVRSEGKSPLRRSRLRWDNNIKMVFKKVVWQAWTGLIRFQDRDRCQVLANAVINVQVPKCAGNFSTTSQPSSFSARTLPHGVN